MTDTLDARRELLRRRLAQRGAATTASTPAAPASAPTDGLRIPERRMWKIHQLDPASVSHNLTLVLSTDLDTARLVAGVEAVLANAPVLSSVIVDGDVPRRESRTVAGRWLAAADDWALGTGADRGSDPHEIASTLARTPFDLSAEPPVRARILGSTAVLSFHHLALDDTSWPLLLGSILAGEWTSDLSASGGTGDGDLQRALDHARRTWAADDVRFPISGELPSTTPEESWLAPLDEAEGSQLRVDLDPADLAAFTAFAPNVGGTGNAALVVLTALTVTAITGSTDHVLLVPADIRRAGATPDVVGYCGNIVPIRFTFSPDGTVADALRTGISAVYQAMEHAPIDYGQILTGLRQSGGRFPVAEILGSVRNAPLRGVPVPEGTAVDCRSVSCGIAPYPMTLAIELSDTDRGHLEVDYQTTTGEALAAAAATTVPDLLKCIPLDPDAPLRGVIVPTTPRGQE